jgi:preprotein translocase subunit YajC
VKERLKMETTYIYLFIAYFLVMFVLFPIIIVIKNKKEDKKRQYDREASITTGSTIAFHSHISSDSGGGDAGV